MFRYAFQACFSSTNKANVCNDKYICIFLWPCSSILAANVCGWKSLSPLCARTKLFFPLRKTKCLFTPAESWRNNNRRIPVKEQMFNKCNSIFQNKNKAPKKKKKNPLGFIHIWPQFNVQVFPEKWPSCAFHHILIYSYFLIFPAAAICQGGKKAETWDCWEKEKKCKAEAGGGLVRCLRRHR